MKSDALRTLRRFLCLVLMLTTGVAAAQTVYITDQLEAGLHEEKRLDSPISKVVPTGTELQVIKREEETTFVRTPDGATGWIDNSYLVEDNPGTPPQVAAEKRIRELEEELTNARQEFRVLKARQPRETPQPAAVTELKQENSELQKQLKAEKLKAGELQVQMSELRKRLGMDNEKESLYREIEQLTQKNKELEVQLARATDNPEAVINESNPGYTGTDSVPGWRQWLIYLGITLIVGLLLGIYLMDLLNRRRHGGFRV